MTPFELSVLIHHHVSPAPWHTPSKLYDQVLLDFVRRGLIIDHFQGERPTLTPHGRAWLDLILSTPVPIIRYIDPRTDKEVMP